MNQDWFQWRMRKSGQSLAEYGLILALVSLVCIAGLNTLGQTISAQLNEIENALTLAMPPTGGAAQPAAAPDDGGDLLGNTGGSDPDSQISEEEAGQIAASDTSPNEAGGDSSDCAAKLFGGTCL